MSEYFSKIRQLFYWFFKIFFLRVNIVPHRQWYSDVSLVFYLSVVLEEVYLGSGIDIISSFKDGSETGLILEFFEDFDPF